MSRSAREAVTTTAEATGPTSRRSDTSSTWSARSTIAGLHGFRESLARDAGPVVPGSGRPPCTGRLHRLRVTISRRVATSRTTTRVPTPAAPLMSVTTPLMVAACAGSAPINTIHNSPQPVRELIAMTPSRAPDR